MEYAFTGIPGFEGRTVAVRSAGFFTGAKLLVDGQPVKGNFWGKYTLHRNDGTDAVAQLRATFIDPVPQLVVDGKLFTLAKPLAWYEILWGGAVIIVLAFLGGILGAVCGAIAAYANARVFRMKIHPALKYLISGAISVTAVIIYLVIAVLFSLLTRGASNV